jgi:hypothetical protein
MNQNYKLICIAIVLCMPFCGHRPKESQHIAISSAEISLSVQLDVLQAACERKLAALEGDTTPKADKRAPAQSVEAVSASEAVHYKPK